MTITPYDAAWKLLFSFPVMPHDLLTGFVPREWVRNLDLPTPRQRRSKAGLKRHPGSHVSNGLLQRHSDMVWEVSFRDQTSSALVALEFQSTVDPTMAVRMLVYTALLYQGRLRSRKAPDEQAPPNEQEASSTQESPEKQDTPPRHDRSDDQESPGGEVPNGEAPNGEAPADNLSEPLPPVLPIVLYHGKPQWTAKEDMAGVCAPPTESLAPYQPEQRYFLLDLRRYPAPLPEGRNLFAILVRLVQSRCLEEEAVVVDELIEWLHEEATPENLARAFWTWMGYAHVPAWRRGMDWPVLRDWREAGTMLRESVNEWTTKWREEGRVVGRVEGRAEGRVEGRVEGQAEGRVEGQAEGRVEGEIAVMRRQAARKFGAETAERLAGRLAEIADPEQAVEVGEWLIECESGEELLARVARLCESTANGEGTPPG